MIGCHRWGSWRTAVSAIKTTLVILYFAIDELSISISFLSFHVSNPHTLVIIQEVTILGLRFEKSRYNSRLPFLSYDEIQNGRLIHRPYTDPRITKCTALQMTCIINITHYVTVLSLYRRSSSFRLRGREAISWYFEFVQTRLASVNVEITMPSRRWLSINHRYLWLRYFAPLGGDVRTLPDSRCTHNLPEAWAKSGCFSVGKMSGNRNSTFVLAQ